VKALRGCGYRVVLVNSNPATIMTDPEIAEATYIEPLTVEALEAVILQERPDALLPTVGGQTSLNLAVELAERGILRKHGVELIGASVEAIRTAEDRAAFRQAMEEAGLPVPRGGAARNAQEARSLAAQTGYPLIVRASFALGGAGASWVYTPEELEPAVERALALSPIGEAWLEESVLGWKEFELEVMRDRRDNFVVICGIENLDAMGVHTGDSITVAPIQTLTDREYQIMRDLARRVMRAVGVETGGSNVQFAVHPGDGRMLVIEMNPRVSRSSALASKATGFPIAKIAALLAVGHTLDEIRNDITGETCAAFEPSLDYVVVKIPRWAFEKFPRVDPLLGPQMKSVGEVMALGRTFPEALQKAVQSLEIGVDAMDGSGPKRGPASGGGASVGSSFRGAATLGSPLAGSAGGGPASGSAATLATEAGEGGTDRDDLRRPTWDRMFRVYAEVCAGGDIQELARRSGYDPWFLVQMREIAACEEELRSSNGQAATKDEGAGDEGARDRDGSAAAPAEPIVTAELLRRAKRLGIADTRIERLAQPAPGPFAKGPAAGHGGEAEPLAPQASGRSRPLEQGVSPRDGSAIREQRLRHGIEATFHRVDTCAAEFRALTPYLYSSYDLEDESAPTDQSKVLILGGGPNRIGQGIEFDYCCCQASFALLELGFETIMLNCNPETVSTDYDTAGRLYFEPLTLEHVLGVIRRERPAGVIVQFGGQTPLNLAEGLQKAGVPIWGTSPESISLAEDRERFARLLQRLDIPQPENGTARTLAEAAAVAENIGYPVLIRPSFVLGGRAMAIIEDRSHLEQFAMRAFEAAPGAPLLVDRFMEDAYEIDVDALCDGRRVVIGAVMQHIEEAGVHSGDSACVLPPYKVSAYHLNTIREYTERLGLALGVKGLMNVQYAIKDEVVYVLEVNPRASRTVPFASKATGVNLARLASLVMAGRNLEEIGFTEEPPVDGFFIKAAVLPFRKLPGADAILGPEMRSTGEVMGHASSYGHAFAKSQIAAGAALPVAGTVLVSVNDYDKGAALKIARDLHRLGYRLLATPGTAQFFGRTGLPVEPVRKVSEGSPHVVDAIRDGSVQLIINTPLGPHAHSDGADIRAAATDRCIPLLTTLSAAAAAVAAIRAMRGREFRYRSLQSHHQPPHDRLASPPAAERSPADPAVSPPGSFAEGPPDRPR